MSLSLHTIKKSKGTLKKRKRLGRGNSSGDGNYSGKGMKGQKSRSGVSGLKRLGMKKILKQTPKLRGFKSIKSKDQVVNLSDLNDKFNDNDTIDIHSLFKKRLISKKNLGVKLLGNGELKLKNLKIKKEEIKMSISVKKKLNLED